MFSYISLCTTCDPWGGPIFDPGAGLFLPKEYYFNKIGICPLGDAAYKISRYLPYGVIQEKIDDLHM